MNTSKALLTVVFTFSIAISVFAQSSDTPSITFLIPTQLNNLHQDVEMIRIICDVRDEGNQKVGTGNTTVRDITEQGSLQQDITVSITQLSGKDITTATHYECSLNVHNGEMWAEINDPGIGYIWAQAKEGTPLVREVTGDINW